MGALRLGRHGTIFGNRWLLLRYSAPIEVKRVRRTFEVSEIHYKLCTRGAEIDLGGSDRQPIITISIVNEARRGLTIGSSNDTSQQSQE